MGVIPERKEYKNFTYERYLTLSDKASQLGFKKVTHTPHSEKSHFDKTGFLYENKKVVVVYDVKANMLTITAQENAIKKLSALIDAKKVADKPQNEKKKGDKEKPQSEKPKQKETKKNFFSELFAKKEPTEDKVEVRKGKKDKKAQKELLKEKQKKEKQKDQSKEQVKQKKKEELREQKQKQKEQKQKERTNKRSEVEKPAILEELPPKVTVTPIKGRNGTYSVIEDCYPLSFAKAMHKIRNHEEVKINTLRASKSNNEYSYAVIMGDNQCEMLYSQNEGTLDISGTATAKIKEMILAFGGVEKHASTVEEKTDDYVVVLKNKMPSALAYLSTQEKNDLASGLKELEKAVDHYEYSMFLLSPFKGLENFIFDLLKSKNITVKMIGQAYEKSEKGAYVLKESYQNRCGVVYSEVMAALYEEYFATRNFYAHADVNGSHNIGSKKDAIAVVNRIYKTIEYNCKKLTEINFKIVR
ncbi:MAG: type II toxin-antitoxin system RnlA family toxin [Clostridia bacterium]|nr:type II toxin-antitoxin system RnlA family toxin [Clostridia bacterium]